MKANHDLHLHTRLSSCCRDDEMTEQAIAAFGTRNGYDTLCVTNHMWDSDVPGASSWYAPQDIEHVRSGERAARENGLHFGCETEYCGMDKLGLTPAHFSVFDFVAIPVNHMHMEGFVRPAGLTGAAQMAELVVTRLEQLISLPLPFRKVGIAHLSGSLMYKEGDADDVLAQMDEARLSRVFQFLAARGAGIELNSSALIHWQRRPQDHLRIYRIAKEAGCLFYCASDAHQLNRLSGVPDILPDVIAALDISEARRYHIAE